MRNNSIISGVFWTMGERCIAQIVSFIVSIVLARLLSPTDYGVVAILLIFISIADVFVINLVSVQVHWLSVFNFKPDIKIKKV